MLNIFLPDHPSEFLCSLTWSGSRRLLIDVLLVEKEHYLKIVKLLAWMELV